MKSKLLKTYQCCSNLDHFPSWWSRVGPQEELLASHLGSLIEAVLKEDDILADADQRLSTLHYRRCNCSLNTLSSLRTSANTYWLWSTSAVLLATIQTMITQLWHSFFSPSDTDNILQSQIQDWERWGWVCLSRWSPEPWCVLSPLNIFLSVKKITKFHDLTLVFNVSPMEL